MYLGKKRLRQSRVGMSFLYDLSINFRDLFMFIHFLNIYLGKKRLRQSIDELFVWFFHRSLRFSKFVHNCLNSYLGKKRLRQRREYLFIWFCEDFQDFLICSLLFEHLFGQKAPAAEQRWSFHLILLRFSRFSSFCKKTWTSIWAKNACGRVAMIFLLSFHKFSSFFHFSKFGEHLFGQKTLAAEYWWAFYIIFDIGSVFLFFSSNLNMYLGKKRLRQSRVGMSFLYDLSTNFRNLFMFIHFLNIYLGKKRLRQSIDELFVWFFHRSSRFSKFVHNCLNSYLGKKRLRQRREYLFIWFCEDFQDFLICSLLFEHLFGQKAPAAE